MGAFKVFNFGGITFASQCYGIYGSNEMQKLVFNQNAPIQPKINIAILIWLDMTNYIANNSQHTCKKVAHVKEMIAERMRHQFTRKWGDHPLGFHYPRISKPRANKDRRS